MPDAQMKLNEDLVSAFKQVSESNFETHKAVIHVLELLVAKMKILEARVERLEGKEA